MIPATLMPERKIVNPLLLTKLTYSCRKLKKLNLFNIIFKKNSDTNNSTRCLPMKIFYITLSLFSSINSLASDPIEMDGRNYARVVCQRFLADDSLGKQVVILEQRDASIEDGKDLINRFKTYNSEDVEFSLTIYKNATLVDSKKSKSEIIDELLKRNQEPDYIGVASHNGRTLSFGYNGMEIVLGIELSDLKNVTLRRTDGGMGLTCEKPTTFQKPFVAPGDCGEK